MWPTEVSHTAKVKNSTKQQKFIQSVDVSIHLSACEGGLQLEANAGREAVVWKSLGTPGLTFLPTEDNKK